MGTDEMRSDAEQVKEAAAQLGFDACGIADATIPIDPDDRLGAWLTAGYHADMAWMAQTCEMRRDPARKLPGVQSVVVVVKSYYVSDPAEAERGSRVARYAWGRDYHRALHKPLRQLAAHIEKLDPTTESYCCIDTGPVWEKAWAARAGIGWIGKNSCVINRRLGSWFVLGVILTTARIAPDPAAQNHCGTCHRCIDACPTKAIAAPGVVDSNRCISYLTIENKGEIPPELAEKLGDWAFGCDICQEVCPWNRDVAATTDPDFQPRSGHVRIDLARIEKMSDDSCKALFEGSPIRRAGRDGLLRNLRAGTKKSTS